MTQQSLDATLGNLACVELRDQPLSQDIYRSAARPRFHDSRSECTRETRITFLLLRA